MPICQPRRSILSRYALDRATLCEVLAAPGHGNVAAGFGLALALQGPRGVARDTLSIVWVRQNAVSVETGELSGEGLAAFGVDPDRLVLVRLRTPMEVLRAALEAARCPAVGAVIIELKQPIDLTASRRLKLAIEKSGVTLILVRHSDSVIPNAAQIRWLVRAAPSDPCPSKVWCRPTFDVTVLKHRAGLPERRSILEWDRDRAQFSEALSRTVAAVPDGRSLATGMRNIVSPDDR